MKSTTKYSTFFSAALALTMGLLPACAGHAHTTVQQGQTTFLPDKVSILAGTTYQFMPQEVNANPDSCTGSDLRILISEFPDQAISNALSLTITGGTPTLGQVYTVSDPQTSADTTSASGTFGALGLSVDFIQSQWGGSAHNTGVRDRPQVTIAKITFTQFGTDLLAGVVVGFDVTFYSGARVVGTAQTSVRAADWGTCSP